MARNPTSNRWCITVWEDYVGEAWEPTMSPEIKYMVYQKERCPETNRGHWHVYVRYDKRKKFSTLRRVWPEGSHLEIARGSEEEARDYCTKEESREKEGRELGEYDPEIGNRQGERTDMEEIMDLIRTGATLRELTARYPGQCIRYHAGLQKMIECVGPETPIEREVEVLILWGPTGTGKTHRILHAYPQAYLASPGRDPWGQYRGQATVLFDEFDWEKWTLQEMNRFLDKWRCPLDARYYNRYAEWTLAVICANSNPGSWWPSASPLLMDALKRRIRGKCFFVDSQEPSLEEIRASQPTPL